MNDKQPVEAMDESQIPEPHGIGGWLGFFVFCHCLGLVIGLIILIDAVIKPYAPISIRIYTILYIAFEAAIIIAFCRGYIAFRVVLLVSNVVLLAFAYFITADKIYAISQLVVQGIGSGLNTLYFFSVKACRKHVSRFKGCLSL